jgi:hypothetical protein
MRRIVTVGRFGWNVGWTWLSAEPTFSYTVVWSPKNSYVRSEALGGAGVVFRSSHEDGAPFTITRHPRGSLPTLGRNALSNAANWAGVPATLTSTVGAGSAPLTEVGDISKTAEATT